MRRVRSALSRGEVDRNVRGVFERQFGRASREQLLAAGLSVEQLRRRRESGALVEVHRGVYAPAPVADLRRSREMAAHLACGPDSFIAAQAALAMWGLWVPWKGAIDVIVPGRKCRPRPGINAHRSQLPRADRRRRDGIPLTSPARALIDAARAADPAHVARALEDGRRLKLIDPERLRARPRLPRALAALLADLTHDPRFTRSGMERRVIELCRFAQLPAPLANHTSDGYEVDLAWPAHRVCAEYDSWEFHHTPEAQHRDAHKGNRLQAADWEVVRISELRLKRFPYAVVADIAGALARGRARRRGAAT